MIRTFYVLAWFLLIWSAMVLAFKGSLDEVSVVVFGLIALILVQGLALYLAIVNTQDTEREQPAGGSTQ